MRAGTLRDRVIVEEAVPSQDSTGELVTAWVLKTTVWANIVPLSGREVMLLAAQGTAEVSTRIRMRWSKALSAMTPSWRLRSGSTIYNIKSVIDTNNANQELELLCQSGVNTG